MPRSHRSRSRKTAATSARDARAPSEPWPLLPGIGHEAADQGGGAERERHEDEEDLPPRHQLSERAAHQDAQGRSDAQPREGHSLPERQTVGRRGGRDDRPVVGEVHPLGEARQQARQGQDRQRAGQARDQRRPGHQQDADDQDPLPPEPVAEESRRHLHGDVPVEEHREQEAALRVAQAELRHDGLEQRREGHADDVVADPAEDQEGPHGVIGLPGHPGTSDQARCDEWVCMVRARRATPVTLARPASVRPISGGRVAGAGRPRLRAPRSCVTMPPAPATRSRRSQAVTFSCRNSTGPRALTPPRAAC